MRDLKASFTVAAVLVGTVVGAGYASGRELWDFYGSYGPVGVPSSLATGLLLGLAACRALSLAEDAPGYAALSSAWPSAFALALEGVGTLFLWVILAATLAAAGALTSSMGGLSFLQGLILFGALIGALALGGARSLASVHSLLVPYMVLFFGALTLGKPIPSPEPSAPHPALPFPFFWAALLYAAYNFLPLLGALLALDLDVARRGRRGAVFGGLLLGLLSALAVLLLLRHPPDAQDPLPFLTLARGLGPLWVVGYQALLLAALSTTALSSQVALQQRLKLPSALAVPIPLLAALPLAILGLPWIVSRLYPVVGAASLGLLAFVLWPRRRRR